MKLVEPVLTSICYVHAFHSICLVDRYIVGMYFPIVDVVNLRKRIVYRFLRARSVGNATRLPNVLTRESDLELQTARAQHHAEWLLARGCVDTIVLLDNTDDTSRVELAMTTLPDLKQRPFQACLLALEPNALHSGCATDPDGAATSGPDALCRATDATSLAQRLLAHCKTLNNS